MGNLFFWLGVGPTQKGAASKPIERRHWVASLIVGILGALLIAVGKFFSVGQPPTNEAALSIGVNEQLFGAGEQVRDRCQSD